MAKKTKKSKSKYYLRGLLALLVILIIFVAQAYILPPGKVVGEGFIKFLPLPAAFVNADAVILGDFYDRVGIADKISNVTDKNRSAILEQLIDNKIAELTAANKRVSVSSQELDNGYAFLQKTTAKEQLGAEYGISEKEFKNQILKPDLTKTKLQVWLASNKTLSAAAYKKIDQVKAKLTSGASFENTAQQFSEDAKSAQIGGDMGFVSYKDLVPELFNQLDAIKDRDAHVLVSRYGINVVQVTDKDNKGPNGSVRYHLKQIFIATADYSNWFNQQKNYYTVLKLVR